MRARNRLLLQQRQMRLHRFEAATDALPSRRRQPAPGGRRRKRDAEKPYAVATTLDVTAALPRAGVLWAPVRKEPEDADLASAIEGCSRCLCVSVDRPASKRLAKCRSGHKSVSREISMSIFFENRAAGGSGRWSTNGRLVSGRGRTGEGTLLPRARSAERRERSPVGCKYSPTIDTCIVGRKRSHVMSPPRRRVCDV